VIQLHCGNSLDVLATLGDDSVDSIVTDPPYGLSFMGRKWDYDVPSVDIWQECFRVLKPGGHLLAFAGTRTQHRMAVNIEDAGFEIRDMIAWVYGSGFPKGKSCLKPALEPITMARKRAKKVQPLNIDGCRVATDERIAAHYGTGGGAGHTTGKFNTPYQRGDAGEHNTQTKGRWPANLIHDGSDEVTQLFPQTTSGKPSGVRGASKHNVAYADVAVGSELTGFGDSGSAARFFQQCKGDYDGVWQDLNLPPEPVTYNITPNNLELGEKDSVARFKYCAKANKKDREEGNTHPTVKPTDLMAYLVRLITPPGGVVLDPFMGSGSTGKAAVREGFDFIGIEREEEYVAIASKRLQVIQRSILASRSADQNG